MPDDILEVNPILRKMTVEDLAQRYSRTVVWYDGRLIFVCGFSGRMICFHTERRIGEQQRGDSYVEEVFRWDRLEFARPASGWYENEEDPFRRPFMLGYYVKRQWARGINTSNTFIADPAKDPGSGRRMYAPTFVAVEQAYKAMHNERGRVIRNVSLTLDTESVVLRRNMAIVRDRRNPRWQVFVNGFCIATIDASNGWFVSWDQTFKAELCEAIPNWMQIVAASVQQPIKEVEF